MNGKEKVLAALGATSEQPGDDKARIAELEKQVQSGRVEQGRLKQANEKIANLEAELAKYRSGEIAKTAVSKLTDDDLGDTPREFVEKSGQVAANLIAEAQGKTETEIQKLRAEIEERSKNSFLDQIAVQNSVFFEDVGPGGEKETAWKRFRNSNRETYDAIMSTHDAARFNMLVGSFYREIGVPNPSGAQGGAAVPEPRTTVGGGNGGDGGRGADKTYTAQEYLTALEQAESDFRATGDRQKYVAITTELNKALNEGRVK